MDVESVVRRFIVDNFLFEENRKIADDISLMDHGIIDSTGILEMITFVEVVFGIKTEDEEIVPENFDSITNLSSFILKKLEISGRSVSADETSDETIMFPVG